MMKYAIETFLDFSKHIRDLRINSVLATFENSFGEFGEDEVVVRRVYGTGGCYVPVPVV